jgi:hypothetical protein
MIAGGAAADMYSERDIPYGDVDLFVNKTNLKKVIGIISTAGLRNEIQLTAYECVNVSGSYHFGNESETKRPTHAVMTIKLTSMIYGPSMMKSALYLQIILVDETFLPVFLTSFDSDYIQCGVYKNKFYYSDRFVNAMKTGIHSEIRLFGSRKRLAKGPNKGFKTNGKELIHVKDQYVKRQWGKLSGTCCIKDIYAFIEKMTPIDVSRTKHFKWCKVNSIKPTKVVVGKRLSYHKGCATCHVIKNVGDVTTECPELRKVRLPMLFIFDATEVDSRNVTNFSHTSCLCEMKYSTYLNHQFKTNGYIEPQNNRNKVIKSNELVLVMLRYMLVIYEGKVTTEVEFELKDLRSKYPDRSYYQYETLKKLADNYALSSPIKDDELDMCINIEYKTDDVLSQQVIAQAVYNHHLCKPNPVKQKPIKVSSGYFAQ